ncbi:MAG: autotransporter-associated beta strand repeat-containing protein [Planctomycetia bacterium]|nr:autotransporter-associated beta strand repeat-containing protein [Planctomycetia bacterium]
MALPRNIFARVTCALLASLLTSPALAQSTWLPTSGTTAWTTGTAWSGGVPNGVDSVAVFPSGGPTVSLVTTSVTTGTIRASLATGQVTLGSTATTDDVIVLSVTSGSPAVEVAGGGRLNMYANIEGTQGLSKTGGGELSFRFNSHNMAYTGTVSLGGGTLTLNQDGSLGAASNPILVTANTTLTSNPGTNTGTVTLGVGRTTTINPGVTLAVQNGTNAVSTVLNNPIGGSGNLTLAASGTITVGAANTYSGNTTLTNLTRANLSSGANLSTAGTLTIATGSNVTYGTTLDLGGNTQSVSGLTISSGTTAVTHTVTNGSLNVTAGNVSLAGSTGSTTSGSSTVSLAGLSSFTFNNSAGTFTANVQTNGSGTNVTSVTLANTGSGANSITAGTVTVGGATQSTGLANSTLLGLGKTNAFNTNTLNVGGFNGAGTIAYQPGVSNGSFLLRGAAGGVSRTGTAFVGWTSSGVRVGDGTLDLTNGSADIRADTVIVGRHGASANNTVVGSVTMGSGTFDALSMVLGEKTETTGSPTITGSFAQSGGQVLVGTLRFGNILSSTSTTLPTFATSYALSNGTLRAGVITSQGSTITSQTSAVGSLRQISWTSGTIANYDSATDLVISGTTTNAGYTMKLVLGGTATPQVFLADAGRTIAVGSSAVISGSGQLQKKGDGSLILNGSNSFVGSLTVTAGTLKAGNVNAFSSGAVSLASGATLDLNSLGVTNAVTNNGGTVSNAASYAGTQTLNGASTFATLGGTLNVASGGAATLGGALSGVMTIASGGTATLTDGGSLAQALLTNNGLFVINRSGTSSVSTPISGSGGVQKLGTGRVTLAGTSDYAGATAIDDGTLIVTGLLSGSGAVTVGAGATLGGSGTLSGPVSVLAGAVIAPGTSPGTLTATSDFTLVSASILNFELSGTDATVGNGINDLITVGGGLTLAGTLNVAELSTFSAVANGTQWRLFDYAGTLTGSSLTFGTMPTLAEGQSFQIDTATPNQVNLVVVPEPHTLVLAGIGAATLAWRLTRRRVQTSR